MNMMTAITAVPAFVAAPALALASPPERDEGQEAYDNGLEVARMDAALAWLSKFTEAGGELLIDRDDCLAIFCPSFNSSLDGEAFDRLEAQIVSQDWHKKLTPKQRAEHENRRRSAAADYFDGKMRALTDLLDAMPDVRRALKDIVEIAPHLGFRPREAIAA